MPGASECTLDALDEAVKALAGLTFAERERFLVACGVAASHDGAISVDEHLVVRAIADALDVPMPVLAEV
jgi:tellurite resistance protein